MNGYQTCHPNLQSRSDLILIPMIDTELGPVSVEDAPARQCPSWPGTIRRLEHCEQERFCAATLASSRSPNEAKHCRISL